MTDEEFKIFIRACYRLRIIFGHFKNAISK